MKKLVIAALAALIGVAVQAATYSWQTKVSWITATSDDDDSTVDGFLAYAFDANQYALSTITTALGGGNIGVLDDALKSGTVDSGEIKLNGTGLTDNGATPPYASMYLIVLDAADADDAAHYYAHEFTSIQITDAVSSDMAAFSTGDLFVGATSTWSTVGAPEPTSGLLLLLGLSGLALKRKNA